ncbi:hypothetical protein IE53DRAFT_321921, partial [Violaceomyces palustris]
LLEAGILFHSIFIGEPERPFLFLQCARLWGRDLGRMSLSVTKSAEFVPYFIAIIFHQALEGLSLGSRISLLKFESEKYPGSPRWTSTRLWRESKPYLMSMAYGLTLPLGQVIGLVLIYSSSSAKQGKAIDEDDGGGGGRGSPGYDPESPSNLILIGSMNAFSAGLLIWSALVQLISADFLGPGREKGLMRRGWRWRWSAWSCLLLGSACMTFVAKWAVS